MPQSLWLYSMCRGMDWNHLPVAGGLYDQHPRLLDEWAVIMPIDAAIQKAKQDKNKPKGR